MNSFFYHHKQAIFKKGKNILFLRKKILRSANIYLQNQQPSSWRLRNDF